MDDSKKILNAMIDIIPKESSQYGSPLKPKELYIPPAHKKALQLHSNIVVGARGVGKSTWALALADSELRAIIGGNIKELENASVQIGFAEKPNPAHYPSEDNIKKLQKNNSHREIWKTVIIRWLCNETGEAMPLENWEASVLWVKNNSDLCTQILEKANNYFISKNVNGLILFDALDRLSDNWEEMNNLARELLRLVLDIKVYSNIHAKVFLREDQLSRSITDFPDASKILTTKIELDWEIRDLHGLLWQLLCNALGEGGNILRNFYNDVINVAPLVQDNYRIVNDEFKKDIDKQRALFEKIAGPWMGKNKKRGIPYIWTVGHLADSRKRTSPRSFLNAIRTAAENSLNKTGDYPIHYESIKMGVQSASINRVDEITEDYPWVESLCRPLSPLNVPAPFTEIEKIWGKEYPSGPSTIKSNKLPPQDIDRGWIGIRKELGRIGVFEEMRDGRINMPDLYRVGFGLGRKGGVPPVYR